MCVLYAMVVYHSVEAVSALTLSVEVLLTVCVCEVELRRGSVFCELARLMSRLLVTGQSHTII